jgi:Ca-activated chloride channel family protein
VLDAPWNDAPAKQGAATFLAYLKAKPAQERAMALGFRPVDPAIKITAPIDAAHGCDPLQPQTLLEVPDAPTLDALVASWREAKKAADVVVVFDKSGSMTGRPLEEAKRGAKAFLATLDARDQVTLEFFDGQVYPPFGPVEVGKAKAELEQRIDGISAHGETAVYDATQAAIDMLARHRAANHDHRIRAVVVMTDGVDNKSAKKLAQLTAGLSGEDTRPATVFTIAYGDQTNPDALQQIATAGAGSFSSGNVDSIIEIFKDLAAFF